MVPPAFVYHYRSSATKNIENIKNCQFWVSHPSRFNDPFDCAEAMVHNRPSDVKANIFADSILNMDMEQTLIFSKQVVDAENASSDHCPVSPREVFLQKQLSMSNGVVCFSEEPKSLLMWSHYAESHQGFCLEFSTELEPFSKQLFKVKYEARMPSVVPGVRDLGDLYDLKQFMLVKAREWKYEKEWRIISSTADTPLKYPPESLKRIIVGAKAKPCTINALQKACAGRSIVIVQLQLCENHFRLKETPVSVY